MYNYEKQEFWHTFCIVHYSLKSIIIDLTCLIYIVVLNYFAGYQDTCWWQYFYYGVLILFVGSLLYHVFQLCLHGLVSSLSYFEKGLISRNRYNTSSFFYPGINRNMWEPRINYCSDPNSRLWYDRAFGNNDSSINRTKNESRNISIVENKENEFRSFCDIFNGKSVTAENEMITLVLTDKMCHNLLGIETRHIYKWISNLRLWISTTVMSRLVSEIKNINDTAEQLGFRDICVGNTGLEYLRRSACMSHIVQYMPRLPLLVKFLSVSDNQEYLVQRINELSTDYCLGDYKWDSGGDFCGKPWSDSLVPDAMIVMHMLASYLDLLLYPGPEATPSGKPFTSAHFVCAPQIPVINKYSLIIYQTNVYPPHYNVVIGHELHQIPQGSNNLFFALLVFFHHAVKKDYGILENVTLGSSGLNLAWIFRK